jgi:hypothetical protein
MALLKSAAWTAVARVVVARPAAARGAVAVTLLAMAFGAFSTAGWAQTASESQVKAMFLFNFVKFVQWPTESFKAPSDPIVICVPEDSTIGGAVEEAVSGKTVEGRGLVVRRISEPCRGCACHILFVGAGKTRAKVVLDEAKGSKALTVGETDGFAEEGGMINFKLVDAKVRLEINITAADREGIRISSKLLGLARIVKK